MFPIGDDNSCSQDCSTGHLCFDRSERPVFLCRAELVVTLLLEMGLRP